MDNGTPNVIPEPYAPGQDETIQTVTVTTSKGRVIHLSNPVDREEWGMYPDMIEFDTCEITPSDD